MPLQAIGAFALVLFILSNLSVALPQDSVTTATGAVTAQPSSASLPCASSSSCTPQVVDITGPLLNDVLADPSILKDGDVFYAYATEHEKAAVNVPYAISKNGLRGDWQPGRGDAMPRNASGTGSWTIDPHGDSGLWNPDVSRLNATHLIMYYSARSATAPGNERCIGVAYATSPTGPFQPTDEAWYCPPSSGAIGVDGVIDSSRTPPERYVLFKNGSFGGAEKNKELSHITLWQVSADDGVNKVGDPVSLTQSSENAIGEESPALTRMPGGRWLLLHTEGVWNQNYTTVYAVSEGEDIKGPYHDYHLNGVLLATGNTTVDGKEFWRPGGPDFVDGTDNFIFAAMQNEQSLARQIYAARIGYT